jgi:hypothetical protein
LFSPGSLSTAGFDPATVNGIAQISLFAKIALSISAGQDYFCDWGSLNRVRLVTLGLVAALDPNDDRGVAC